MVANMADRTMVANMADRTMVANMADRTMVAKLLRWNRVCFLGPVVNEENKAND